MVDVDQLIYWLVVVVVVGHRVDRRSFGQQHLASSNRFGRFIGTGFIELDQLRRWNQRLLRLHRWTSDRQNPSRFQFFGQWMVTPLTCHIPGGFPRPIVDIQSRWIPLSQKGNNISMTLSTSPHERSVALLVAGQRTHFAFQGWRRILQTPIEQRAQDSQ